jgi:transposase InsO family protein
MVIACPFSKDVALVELPDIKAPTVATAFWKEWVAYHWLPDSIVLDRGSQFVSDFSKTLAEIFGIRKDHSTAIHPQTDGATERMNSVVETIFRQYINWKQDNWVSLLPVAGQVSSSSNSLSRSRSYPPPLPHLTRRHVNCPPYVI